MTPTRHNSVCVKSVSANGYVDGGNKFFAYTTGNLTTSPIGVVRVAERTDRLSTSGWIGVDLDGTLAEYVGWQGPDHIGKPVPRMLARVRQWLADGVEVRIFTARVSHDPDGSVRRVIDAWTMEHCGVSLPVTCSKDYGMVELFDDRCVQIIANTGIRADGKD